MMSHGLVCLLLAMHKYNKQVKSFPKRDKSLTRALSFSGWSLITLTIIISINYFGVGNGLVWFFAILTLCASFICLMFSFTADVTAGLVFFLPVNILKLGLNKYSALIYLLIYLTTCLTLWLM
jgi:hypothetical protein